MSTSCFDLVVRNARAATASDVFTTDIGIRDSRIVQLGSGLPEGAREIDARGRVVTPGGIDAHCHLDQPSSSPVKMADDFNSGTISAACGGTTTVIPFAAQQKGHSLRAAVEDYHRRADGVSHIDYAFHLIVSDPTPEVLKVELPELIGKGYTSFKAYMTYDDLKLDEDEIRARRAHVQELVEELNAQRAEERIGEHVDVLVESRDEEDRPVGRAAHQGPEVDGTTALLGSQAAVGDLVRAEVVGTDGVDLIARAL